MISPDLPIGVIGSALAGLGSIAAVLAKYGGKIIAIFTRMEMYQQQTAEHLKTMNDRLENVERYLIAGKTVDTLQLASSNGRR